MKGERRVGAGDGAEGGGLLVSRRADDLPREVEPAARLDLEGV